MEDNTFDHKEQELKSLKRKNRRRNVFWTLLVLQAGSMLITYYLGRSHKG